MLNHSVGLRKTYALCTPYGASSHRISPLRKSGTSFIPAVYLVECKSSAYSMGGVYVLPTGTLHDGSGWLAKISGLGWNLLGEIFFFFEEENIDESISIAQLAM